MAIIMGPKIGKSQEKIDEILSRLNALSKEDVEWYQEYPGDVDKPDVTAQPGLKPRRDI